MNDIPLNAGQQAAADAFNAFTQSDDTLFALLGYAGTGKTFTLARLLGTTIAPPTPARDIDSFFSADTDGEVLFGTPTHKAAGVARKFLDRLGLKYEVGYDKFHHRNGVMITGTTAQLLGIRPIISEDQTAKKQDFAKAGQGILGAGLQVEWIVIDEVSMLSAKQLQDIERGAKRTGAKVLVVGDPGQLPPVKDGPIDFLGLPHVATLDQIMRQQGDSAIPHVAQAIRNLVNWKRVTGPGVDHFDNPAGAFVDEVSGPPDMDEEKRSVFIAYRNARVNAVQEACCRKVYGHGRLDFEPGEVVLAARPLRMKGGTKALCQTGDVLYIEAKGEMGEWGNTVTVRNERGGGFTAEFLSEAELDNQQHPYNLELKKRERAANDLQKRFSGGERSVDSARRQAWGAFFELLNSTILSASHCFAITSHKSQGSTYGTVFVDAADFEGFDHRGLYVAASRPTTELIIG